jgi:hypothetical protein
MSELIATHIGFVLIVLLAGIVLCWKSKYKSALWLGWAAGYLIYNFFYRQTTEMYWGIDLLSIYKWFTAYPFYWLKWFSFETDLIIWYCVQSLFVLWVVKQLLEMKWGWLLVYPYLKLAGWSLMAGNFTAMASALCITPIGALVATTVKPYLIIFYLITVWRLKERWQWISLGVIVFFLSIPSPGSVVWNNPLFFIGPVHYIYLFTLLLIWRKK